MKVIVMDDSKKRSTQIAELLQRRKHQVTTCTDTNSFLTALDAEDADRIVLNVEAWQRGNSIYRYFGTAAKLGAVPVVFYNAPENFLNINARERNEGDHVLTKPAEVEAVVEALD